MNLTLDILMDTINKYRPHKGTVPVYDLIASSFMTDWYDLVKIKRNWRERLFTRPWMPKIKHVYEKGPQVPAMHVFIMGNKIIGHPVIIKKLSNEARRAGVKGEK
jgi:hypothetical protein